MFDLTFKATYGIDTTAKIKVARRPPGKKGVQKMVKTMYETTAEFITERVNYHGAHEPGIIGDAVTKMCDSVNQLRETLTEKQKLTLRDVENHYADVDGETMRYYFKAGFGDALQFLLDWGKRHDQ